MAERKPLNFAAIWESSVLPLLPSQEKSPTTRPSSQLLSRPADEPCLAILQRAVGYVHVQQHPDGKRDPSYFWSQDDDICLGFRHPAQHLRMQLNSPHTPRCMPPEPQLVSTRGRHAPCPLSATSLNFMRVYLYMIDNIIGNPTE